MESISYNATHTKLARVIQSVCEQGEPVLIEAKNSDPVVLLSLQALRALQHAAETAQVADRSASEEPLPSAPHPRSKNMPWITPYLTVHNAQAALEFYESAFGFQQRNTMLDGGMIVHAEMSYRDMVIMLGPEHAFGATALAPASAGFESPLSLYVYCDDVDELFARATASGARISFPPQNMPWGERVCKLFDPDGHAWSFATIL